MHGVCLSAVCPLSVRTARGAALAGWWVCNNKKDDLVMMHALARFEEQLGELDQAEERLHAALETMLAADTDMHTLTAAITTATGEAKAQLAAIREHNERAARGTRRRVLDNVLVDLADDDGSLTMGPVQRRKLLRLIAHMAGRGADELPAFYAALGLKYAAQAAAHADALPSGGMISEPSWQRGYGDADFVVHEAALPGDDPREFPTKEILDQLEELGAFEIIMGLQAPGEGGGGGIDGGGGSEQEEEHAQHARPEGAWEARSGRRDVKRGGAKGSSHLPSEVLPLAVAQSQRRTKGPRIRCRWCSCDTSAICRYRTIPLTSAARTGTPSSNVPQLHLCSSHDPRCLNMTMYGIPPYFPGHTTFWLTLLIQDNLCR